MRTKQNNSHFFLYYSRFAVPLHPQNVIKMKDICCIGHVTKDKIVTPSSTVYMAGGTSFYFAYAINQLPKDVSFSLITAMDPTEKEPVEKMLKAGIDVTLNPSRNTVFFENIYGDNPNDRKQRVLAKAVRVGAATGSGVMKAPNHRPIEPSANPFCVHISITPPCLAPQKKENTPAGQGVSGVHHRGSADG